MIELLDKTEIINRHTDYVGVIIAIMIGVVFIFAVINFLEKLAAVCSILCVIFLVGGMCLLFGKDSPTGRYQYKAEIDINNCEFLKDYMNVEITQDGKKYIATYEDKEEIKP